MKKSAMKILSVILCILIIVSACLPAFASGEKTAFVVVSGMNTFPLYDSEGNKLYPLATSSILKLATDILPDVIAYLVTRDAEKLADNVLPAVYDIFEPIACNSDGESKYGIHTDTFGSLKDYPDVFKDSKKDEEGIVNAAIKKYGVENTFFFNYDWRLDPLDHADDLNDFIQWVKETTSCDRVNIAAFSMGGTVLLSYLEKYGSEDLKNIEFCSTAFQGTSVVGDLFRGEISLSLEGLFRRLGQLTRNENLEQIINYLNEGLTENGFNAKIEDFADALISQIGDRVYDELLIPVFGYMPGLWGLCYADAFEDAKQFMLGDNSDKKLTDRIDYYHSSVQANAAEILENAMEDSNVYIFAQYGMQGLPVSDYGTNGNNDYLIDTIYASGGATCSMLGETLGDDYTQAVPGDYNYLSADGQIDASTCLFPDKTWFIKGMGHVDYPVGAGSDFVFYFADSDKQLTVRDSEYSQFLSYSYSSGQLTEVTGKGSENSLSKVLSFFSSIRSFFIKIFSKINLFK